MRITQARLDRMVKILDTELEHANTKLEKIKLECKSMILNAKGSDMQIVEDLRLVATQIPCAQQGLYTSCSHAYKAANFLAQRTNAKKRNM